MTKYYRDTKYEIRQNIQPRIAPLTAAVSGALAAGSLQAATITVDTVNDSLGSGSVCSLRAALYASTTNSTFDGCAAGDIGEDTIVFDSALSGTIALQPSTGLNYYDGSTLAVGESVVIDGDGEITIQGTGNAPVLYSKYDSNADYNTETLSLYGLTITGGGGAQGGGILSRGKNLSLTSTTISGNTATDAGGGVWHEPYANLGELNLLASQVTGNTVTGAGGVAGGIGMKAANSPTNGVYEPVLVDIAGSNISNNEVTTGDGGGLYVDSADITTVDLKYNQFDSNSASGRGGGALLEIAYAPVTLDENTFNANSAGGRGGGLYLSESLTTFQKAEVTAQYNVFSANTSQSSGGGAFISIANGGIGTIDDPVKFVDFTQQNTFENNQADLSGGGLSLDLQDTVVARLENVVFSDNVTQGSGGGALEAAVTASEITVQNSDFFDNQTYGEGGGAVLDMYASGFYASGLTMIGNVSTNSGGGGLSFSGTDSSFGLEYSAFYSNNADLCGGGVYVKGQPNEIGIGHSIFSGNTAYCGGGVRLATPGASNVLAEIKYSEISNNQITGGTSLGPGQYGGGGVEASLGSGSSLFLKNSTVSGNTTTIGYGGGVHLTGDMSAEVKYTTIANNYAYAGGGGLYNELSSCNISNTILGGNTDQSGAYQDLSGSSDCGVSNSLLAGAKYSSFSDDGGNILNVAPDLGLLMDNGGNAGYTHALQTDSPALDAGSAGSNAPSSDQRGPAYPRIQGSGLDMGAFELGPPIDALFQDRFAQP